MTGRVVLEEVVGSSDHAGLNGVDGVRHAFAQGIAGYFAARSIAR